MAIIEAIEKLKNKETTNSIKTKDIDYKEPNLYIANNPIINKVIKKYSNKKESN